MRQLATRGSARTLGLERELGAVRPGYRADLILIDGDPTQDISAVRRIALTIMDGVGYSPGAIYGALGIAPFAAEPAIRRPATP